MTRHHTTYILRVTALLSLVLLSIAVFGGGQPAPSAAVRAASLERGGGHADRSNNKRRRDDAIEIAMAGAPAISSLRQARAANGGCSAKRGAPAISSLDPPNTCGGNTLTLRGRRFGALRDEVDGKVIIGGIAVRTYLAWSKKEVVVLVPDSVQAGPEQDVYLTNLNGFAKASVTITLGPC